MPHLPPLLISGGSVKVSIPISAVKDANCKEPLFNRRREPVTKPFPPDSEAKYEFELFSLADHGGKIYKIEIHGANYDEVFEFRPKDGDCSVEIYYALANELPLTHEDKWLERGEQLCPEAQYNRK